LPHGQIAADPFHVVQLANKMVAQVRRRVLYAHPPANRDHPDPRLTGSPAHRKNAKAEGASN